MRTRTLNDIMEFDHPVEVLPDGTAIDGPRNVWCPSVYAWDLMEDDPEMDGAGWSFFSRGYTGQYGVKRSDPIMHASEFIGGQLERDILAEPGIYAVTSVEDIDDPDGPWGWVVLRKDDD